MDATKLAELAKWCEQQSRLLAADWEFQSRTGHRLPGTPALPGIRDELVRRLSEIEPGLVAGVEHPRLFTQSDHAAVKLARWVELLAAMAPATTGTAAAPAAATERAAPAASVNAMVTDLLLRKPAASGWSTRQIAAALGCGKSAVAGSQAFKKLATALAWKLRLV